MTGVYAPTEGQIRFQGSVLAGRKRFEITKLGLARTFQNIRLFSEMTALENVQVGTDAHHLASVPACLLRLPRHHREEKQGRGLGPELLDFVGISGRHDSVARNLSYGDQRRLEIARAMATEAGSALPGRAGGRLQPGREGVKLLQLIRRIRDRGITVLLIEHDMRSGHGRDRPDRGVGVRPQDRRRRTARRRQRPQGDRRLSGGAHRCCLRSVI